MKARSGSALLVVLGMLSFMIISGLAFSVYMRTSRLTTSFTRRTVTTRQLAKAALAEAIDQIDRSIGNDPHPGVRRNDADSYNHWLGRVLVSSYSELDKNGDPEEVKPATVISRIQSLSDNKSGQTDSANLPTTVPVLSLEALAYIPPPLVNEVRYYGQKTPTAAWQSFDFDAGRYAFIALDVSDYFDVNRLLVGEARSSNPARRVSAAYLFESGDDEHNGLSASAVSGWESFMDKYRKPQDDGSIEYDPSHLPFFSLADLNLALGNQSFGGFASPFYKYVDSNGSGDDFYGTAQPGNTLWDAYSRMTLVTDSLAAHATPADHVTTFDLDQERDQPFDRTYFNQDFKQRPFSDLADSQKANKAREELARNRISLAGLIALQDYLDYDDVPTSLAVPTTERVPMVCGVQPIADGLKVMVTYALSDKKQNTTAEQPYEEQTVKVSYKMDGPVNVDAWTAFPFRDHAGVKNSFKADCRVALFLSKDEMGLRTVAPGGTDVLRAPTFRDRAALRDGVVNLFVSDQSCSLPGKISKPSDAVPSQIGFNLGDISAAYSGNSADGSVILELTYQWPMTKDQDGNWISQTPTPSLCKVTAVSKSAFAPLLADGKLASAPTIATGKTLAEIDLKQFNAFCNLACWVTVRNGDGYVVDLAPACMADDRAVNSVNNNDEYNEFFQNVAGLRAPLLKFAFSQQGGAAAFSLVDADKLCNGENGEFTFELVHKNGILVRDPRYNHAPENWFAAESKINSQYWVDNAGYANSGCDGDIFMATSDQGYLQSITELAFLPRFTNLNAVPSNQDYGDVIRHPETWSGKDYPTKGNEAQANMMWRTYNPFDTAENRDGFEDLVAMFQNQGRGLRVNPYSDSTNIIMAAFANTPVSWRVASYHDDSKGKQMNPAEDDGCQADASDFNGEHAWNVYSKESDYQISWADLEDVAGAYMQTVRKYAKNGDSWETALQDLFADHRNDNETQLCGVDLEKSGRFYSVDKKMLWGFWQNSFEPQQQLFLVFFRAEPMMLGGGVAGVTPPQLGAKGVALVWRNPNNPKNTASGVSGYQSGGSNTGYPSINTGYIPHQTRILFYRQFE